MTESANTGISRRQLLGGVGVAAASIGTGAAGGWIAKGIASDSQHGGVRAFYDSGIECFTSTSDSSGLVVTFDVLAKQRSLLLSTLRRWSLAAGELMAGASLSEPDADAAFPEAPPADTGEAFGLESAGLAIAIGYGASLFDDRFDLSRFKPAGLLPSQRFARDQLIDAQTGGDILLFITAADEQVAFHAARNLIRMAKGVFSVRHIQPGFLPGAGDGQQTPRNLFGFKDGTANFDPKDADLAAEHLLVAESDEPQAAWLVGGTFAAFRQFRMTLETWDRSSLGEQQQIFGRSKHHGAPLHIANPETKDEFADMDLAAPEIDANSHVALAHPSRNEGHRILRRAFNYSAGIDEFGRLDAGLVFFALQRSLDRQFVPMQTKLAASDLMNEYVITTGSAYFAVPRAPEAGSHWGSEFN